MRNVWKIGVSKRPLRWFGCGGAWERERQATVEAEGDGGDGCAGGRKLLVRWAANKRFTILKFKFKFPIARTFELFRARSRLYRSQILQVNTRWKALAKIYTMHPFAPFSDLNLFFEDRTAPRQRRLSRRVISGKGLKQKANCSRSTRNTNKSCAARITGTSAWHKVKRN